MTRKSRVRQPAFQAESETSTHGTGHGSTFQTPVAYSAMVRSLENLPDARASLLLPAAEEELQQAVALTEGAVAAGRRGNEFGYPYCLFVEGLARHRQGRFDDAIKLMTGEAASVMGPCPGLVVAMAQFQNGQQDEACQTLAAAISSYDWSESNADNPDAWIAHILRREAESTIDSRNKLRQKPLTLGRNTAETGQAASVAFFTRLVGYAKADTGPVSRVGLARRYIGCEST